MSPTTRPNGLEDKRLGASTVLTRGAYLTGRSVSFAGRAPPAHGIGGIG
jgi:hypothetical protein